MSETRNETSKVSALYDNLTPYRDDGASVWVVNTEMRLRYLSIAEADAGGDAGGARQANVRPVRLYPGLQQLSQGYIGRVEADALRQRTRSKGGGILSQTLDSGVIVIVKDLSKANVAKVAGGIAHTANLEAIHTLRSDKKHGEAAERAWAAWHSEEASDHTKTLRHFWAMAEGSRKVA